MGTIDRILGMVELLEKGGAKFLMCDTSGSKISLGSETYWITKTGAFGPGDMIADDRTSDPAFAGLHPEIRERRLTVLRMKREKWTDREIAAKAMTAHHNVKKDVGWLRKNKLLP